LLRIAPDDTPMAGYIYCMRNDHRLYGEYVKIGCTERSPEQRRLELSAKWRCNFEILWDLDVYQPVRAEAFFHEVLAEFRVHYEFFKIDPATAKKLAEDFFDEHWREIEGKEILPPDLYELARRDTRGILLEREQPQDDPDLDTEAH
jgi:hypothetical protein